nr:MAG TPA: hypothetical protein [Caudoviricetes sp.]
MDGWKFLPNPNQPRPRLVLSSIAFLYRWHQRR